MQDFGRWQPASGMPIHLLPIDPTFLATSPQGAEPESAHLGAKGIKTADVGGYRVVSEVPRATRPPAMRLARGWAGVVA